MSYWWCCCSPIARDSTRAARESRGEPDNPVLSKAHFKLFWLLQSSSNSTSVSKRRSVASRGDGHYDSGCGSDWDCELLSVSGAHSGRSPLTSFEVYFNPRLSPVLQPMESMVEVRKRSVSCRCRLLVEEKFCWRKRRTHTRAGARDPRCSLRPHAERVCTPAKH